MTAASNPAAELTEAERAAVTEAQEYARNYWKHGIEPRTQAMLTTLSAAVDRLAAGGAATDEGLRARIEALRNFYASHPEAQTFFGEVRHQLTEALDAAPAPTEDAGFEVEIEAALGEPTTCVVRRNGVVVFNGVQRDWLGLSRAADAAAEEPRTEAQIAARALNDAADAVAHGRKHGIPEGYQSWPVAEHFERWLRDRADRLSADEEAGS